MGGMIKCFINGIAVFMLMMVVSGFLDFFGYEPEMSESYKELTVVHVKNPWD